MKKIVLALTVLSLGGLANASERLSSEELKALYTDSTVSGVHHKLGPVKTYYGPDGKVQSKDEGGGERVGKWWIDEDAGLRCIRWDDKNQDFCHYTEKNGDGSYTLIHGKKGKKLVEIKSVQKGNHL